METDSGGWSVVAVGRNMSQLAGDCSGLPSKTAGKQRRVASKVTWQLHIIVQYSSVVSRAGGVGMLWITPVP